MNESDDDVARRMLAIVAHPDDVEFPAGGTVAAWVAGGGQAILCVVTDGQRGTDGSPSANRRAEQEAAAEALGVHRVIFLGGRDAEVVASLELRTTLAELIRRIRPHRVLTHSPRFAWKLPLASHPDHRAVGEATLDAIYPEARTAVPSDAGRSAWAVREVWLFGDPEANHVEDVTDVVSGKIAALRCHGSQLASDASWERALVTRMAQVAEGAGLASGRLAERFQVIGYP